MATIDLKALSAHLLEKLPDDPEARAFALGAVEEATRNGKLDVPALMGNVGQHVLANAKPELLAAAMTMADLQKALIAYGEDLQKTLAEAAQETDPNRVTALIFDLEQVLPSRRASIISSVESRLASEAKAALESTLQFLATFGVAVAKALVAR